MIGITQRAADATAMHRVKVTVNFAIQGADDVSLRVFLGPHTEEVIPVRLKIRMVLNQGVFFFPPC